MKPKRSLLLTLSLVILATTAVAQSNSNTRSTTAATTRASSATATATSASTSSESLPDVSSSTTTSATTTADSSSADSSSASASESLPNVSSSLPRISSTNGYTIPSVGVPSTANDPFMQRSNLPEGTVFIAVGSALGLFAISVIAWRALVAWLLHRSVKRAARQATMADSKAILRPPPGSTAGFYAAGPGSTLSLDHLGPNGRPNASPSALFFSPTAANPGGVGGDRRSAYLPAGYYAAGTRDSTIMPGPNSSQTHFPSHSVSSSRYGGRGLGVSPPDSPMMAPSGSRGGSGTGSGGLGKSGSESHTSLHLPPTGRAPSAYLEDLLGGQHSPRSPGMGPGGNGA